MCSLKVLKKEQLETTTNSVQKRDENMYEHLAVMFPENCRGHLWAVHYAG